MSEFVNYDPPEPDHRTAADFCEFCGREKPTVRTPVMCCDERVEAEREPKPCEGCGGSGKIEQMRTVTREMAIDAGEPQTEGMPIPDWGRCPSCEGTGYADD